METDTSHAQMLIVDGFRWVHSRWTAPSVLYRPKLFMDGNQWCALYGEDLMSGCAGFGDTPEKAMSAFDEEWRTNRAR